MTDKELLEHIVKHQDSSAFNKLYNQYWRLFYSWVFNRLIKKEDTRDILQNFWVWVWTHPEKIRTDASGSAKNFLLHNLSFRILEYFSSSYLKNITLGDEQLQQEGEALQAYTHVQEALTAKEIQQLIQHIISNLPDMARNIYRLRYIEQFSVTETASELSIQKKTVRNRLSETLAVIRSELVALYHMDAEAANTGRE